jgi:hypothetical protein
MAKPIKPRATAKPSARAKPTKPSARAKPTKPTARTKPTKPTARAKPTKPTARAKPARPRKQPARLGGAPPPASTTADDEPGRATRIATVAAERAKLAADAPLKVIPDGAAQQTGIDHLGERSVLLGSITVPSGTLALFDVGLMGYLPPDALDPMLICAPVPRDRALAVVGTRVGTGRFAGCWDHVVIDLAEPRPESSRVTETGALVVPGRPEVVHARKLGEAAVDFGRLTCMERAAIDHWQHEDSLDQLADFVFWGRDEAALAKALGARRLPHGDGHGWIDLPAAEAEAKADRAAQLRAEHKWLFAAELRPHSHHAGALAAARASPSGAGVIDVAGARVLLFSTSWGNGVYPVYLDVDRDAHPVQIRIQLAPADANATPGAIARPPAW